MGTKLKFFTLGAASVLVVLSVKFWPWVVFSAFVLFNEKPDGPCGGFC